MKRIALHLTILLFVLVASAFLGRACLRTQHVETSHAGQYVAQHMTQSTSDDGSARIKEFGDLTINGSVMKPVWAAVLPTNAGGVLCFNIAPEGTPFSIVVRQADTYGRPVTLVDSAVYYIRAEAGVATVKFFLRTKQGETVTEDLLAEDANAGERSGRMTQHCSSIML
jgi:hypothetical protein